MLLGAGALWAGLYAPAQHLVPTAVLTVLVLGSRGEPTFTLWEAAATALVGAGVALSLARPASVGQAAYGPVVAAGWVLALALGRLLRRHGQVERTVTVLWSVVGAFIVFGGLAGMSLFPVHHSGRLASFLGYPIAVGVMGLLGLVGSLPALSERRWFAGGLACANAIALVLSGSRGVWAVAMLLAVYLAWARPRLLAPLWLPVLAAWAAALWIGPAVAEQALWPAVIPFAISCLTVVFVHAFQPARRFLIALVALALVASAFAPGWGWFLGRATAVPLTEGSSVERLTFLKDGLAMALERPLGAGLRAWSSLYLQGSSYGYVTAEAHSSLLDFTLAFGWAGGIGFSLWMARFFLGLRHGRNWDPARLAFMGGVGALALHALADWDLSYGVFAVPVWLGFGLADGARERLQVGRPWLMGFAGLGLAAALYLGAGSVTAWLSQQAAGRADWTAGERHGALAVSLQPWSDQAWASLGLAQSNLGRREQALASFGRARALHPLEPWYAGLQAHELVQAGRWLEAAQACREYVALWPWNVQAYESALQVHMDLTTRAQLLRDEATARALARSARQILEALDRQKAKEPAQHPRRPMNVDTPGIRSARQFFAVPDE